MASVSINSSEVSPSTFHASRLQRCSASNPKTDMISSEYIILADPVILLHLGECS
jgi:hypothetical protein